MNTNHFEITLLDRNLEEYRNSYEIHVEEDIRRPTFIEYLCCCLYAQIFLSGIVANGAVLRILVAVLRFRIARPNDTHCTGTNNSVLVYLVALCSVNILVLMALPLIISDIGTGEWRLNDFLCSLYWIAETLNKILTSVISASFSLACYFSVCRFNITQMYKSFLVAALILLAGLAITFWHTVTAVKDSGIYYIASYELANQSSENITVIMIRGTKCLFHPQNKEETTTFTISTILCGYGIPALIMLLCYAAILRKVFAQSRNSNRRVSNRFRRTAVSVAVLITFYLCTWTPYWVITTTLNAMTDDADGQKMMSKIAVFTHVLPFLNSAFSPLVYVLLNRDIRTQFKNIANRNFARKETTSAMNHILPTARSDLLLVDEVTGIPPRAQSV